MGNLRRGRALWAGCPGARGAWARGGRPEVGNLRRGRALWAGHVAVTTTRCRGSWVPPLPKSARSGQPPARFGTLGRFSRCSGCLGSRWAARSGQPPARFGTLGRARCGHDDPMPRIVGRPLAEVGPKWATSGEVWHFGPVFPVLGVPGLAVGGPRWATSGEVWHFGPGTLRSRRPDAADRGSPPCRSRYRGACRARTGREVHFPFRGRTGFDEVTDGRRAWRARFRCERTKTKLPTTATTSARPSRLS